MLVVVVLAVLTVLLPALVGGSALTVRTGSMAPTLPVGSLVVDRPVRASDVQLGDIVTYERSVAGERGLVTHRVVAITRTSGGRTFTVRGDANPVADPEPISAADLRGRVWFDLPWVGGFRDAIAIRRPLLGSAALVLLSAYAVWHIAGGVREWRRRA